MGLILAITLVGSCWVWGIVVCEKDLKEKGVIVTPQKKPDIRTRRF